MKEESDWDIQHEIEAFIERKAPSTLHYNLSAEALFQKAIRRKEGEETSTGAFRAVDLPVNRRGRSPKDKFFVKDSKSKEARNIHWGPNQPIERDCFEKIKKKLFAHLAEQKELFVFDGYAGAHPQHRIKLRVINSVAWQNLTAHHLFIRPEKGVVPKHAPPELTLVSAPNLHLDGEKDGVHSDAAMLIDIKNQLILIVGAPYDGEMKKSVFTYLNYLYMEADGVLPMHASASLAENGECVIFCGLSGTGKSTLSARNLTMVADDELGWDQEQGVYNFEGGVFPKTEGLDEKQEPELFHGICDTAVVQNVPFALMKNGELQKKKGKPVLDYKNPYLNEEEKEHNIVTSNGRVVVPLTHLPKAVQSGLGGKPKVLFFLTMDAWGVLPPISIIKDPKMIKYLFLSGYTAKAPGTEVGEASLEPSATFSSLFGEPFFPRPYIAYADRLMEHIKTEKVAVYLLNTGWSGGKYGVGKRMNLNKITIPLRDAAINQTLDITSKNLTEHSIFKGLWMPKEVPGITDPFILNPKSSWPKDKQSQYNDIAHSLVHRFQANAKNKEFSELIP